MPSGPGWLRKASTLRRMTPSVLAGGAGSIRLESEVWKPLAIFHSVAIVGLDSQRSIWPSMALLTPVSCAVRSRLQPRPLRSTRSALAICRFGS